ncbi:MAG TPA: 3'-5' exonuclease, partial [Clostridia bacterium]|nr:3'-5' exonuclease [Clostridia bacterium]
RQLARQVSLSQCLDNVLAETRYDHWLLAQPQGGQRHANLMRLLELARRFDQFQRQGLFRFLRYIEAQQEAGTEPEVPAVTQENSVRLLSIHQSKGLEFPVVVVADVAKPFNEADLKADIILDEKCGLCPQVKPPHSGKRYPSLPYWMARRRQHGEMLGEELRLLYVAMTRSRDTLLLTGTVSATRFEQLWSQADGEMGTTLSRARSYADWLGAWFAHHRDGAEVGQTEGVISGVTWRIYEDGELVLEQAEPKADTAGESVLLRLRPAEVMQQLNWTYPHAGAVGRPAKASVSALRKQAEQEEPSYPIFPVNARAGAVASSPAARTGQGFGGGADVGTAHHLFLQFVSLEATGSVDQLRAEAARMEQEGKLSAEQRRMLNYPSLLGFWQSGLGRSITEQSSCVHRELAFTARFNPNELAELTGTAAEPALEPEFVLVQGVVDLAVIWPEEIWIIDFKTDSVLELEISQRAKAYEPQIELYRRALRRIYQRPVTKAWLYFLVPGQATAIQRRACERCAGVPA